MSGSDIIDAECLAKFWRALARLPRIQRDIFLAHRCENVSYGEIAELTGLTVAEVERHIARAMVKLMKQMEGERLSLRKRLFP